MRITTRQNSLLGSSFSQISVLVDCQCGCRRTHAHLQRHFVSCCWPLFGWLVVVGWWFLFACLFVRLFFVGFFFSFFLSFLYFYSFLPLFHERQITLCHRPYIIHFPFISTSSSFPFLFFFFSRLYIATTSLTHTRGDNYSLKSASCMIMWLFPFQHQT